MSYRVHAQYVDLGSGMHVIELRNQAGQRHLLQIAIGLDHCPSCGFPRAQEGGKTDSPEDRIQAAIERLNRSEQATAEYARRYGLKVKG